MLNVTGVVPAEINRQSQAEAAVLWDAVATVKAKARLYKNNYTPSLGSVLADFTEADFDGYAAVDIDNSKFSYFVLKPDGSVFNNYNQILGWDQSGATTPNTVYGIYFVGGDTTTLLGAARFTTPLSMDAYGKWIRIEFARLAPAFNPSLGFDVESNGA